MNYKKMEDSKLAKVMIDYIERVEHLQDVFGGIYREMIVLPHVG